MTFPKKSACTPLSVKKLLRCIRNMTSSHAEVLISIPSSAVPLNCTKRNGKEGTNVAYQGVSECVLTKYVGDTEMNDWVRNHVRFVNAADFVALIPSLTTLISDGDPALCVHALSVHVPIVGVIHVSHGVSLGKTNDITMNNNTSSNKAMRTFWIHLIHMYLNSFSTSSSTTRSIITTTHNSHAFELSLQHALAGGCSYQVNDIAVQLKQERELCLRWHRARQRYVMLMKDGIGSRMCDYECDWLNDEIERVGDGAVVVARAVLDRVGVRPSKPTRPTRTS